MSDSKVRELLEQMTDQDKKALAEHVAADYVLRGFCAAVSVLASHGLVALGKLNNNNAFFTAIASGELTPFNIDEKVKLYLAMRTPEADLFERLKDLLKQTAPPSAEPIRHTKPNGQDLS